MSDSELMCKRCAEIAAGIAAEKLRGYPRIRMEVPAAIRARAAPDRKPGTEPASAPSPALALAIRFHETYERLAPNFGYATRDDTKQFDATTPNGRLMVAVCGELFATPCRGEFETCERQCIPLVQYWKSRAQETDGQGRNESAG